MARCLQKSRTKGEVKMSDKSDLRSDIERLASMETKMDMVLKAIEDLTKNYPTTTYVDLRFQSHDERLKKVESAPAKWFTSILSIVSILVAVYAIYHN